MIIGIYFIFIFTIGFIYKVDVYDSFNTGIKKGLKQIYSLISPIISLQILVKLIINSGMFSILSSKFNFTNPLISLECFLKPFSYSGSLVVLTNIIQEYGVSSFYTFLGSMILFSSDTTFFIVATYLNNIKNVNYKRIVKCGLLINIFGIIFSIIFSKIFYIH